MNLPYNLIKFKKEEKFKKRTKKSNQSISFNCFFFQANSPNLKWFWIWDLDTKSYTKYLWKTCKWLVKMWLNQIFSQIDFCHFNKNNWFENPGMRWPRIDWIIEIWWWNCWWKPNHIWSIFEKNFSIQSRRIQLCGKNFLIPYKELMNPRSKQPEKLSVSFAMKA